MANTSTILNPVVITPSEELDVSGQGQNPQNNIQGVQEQLNPIIGTEEKKGIVNTILVKEVEYLVCKAIEKALTEFGIKFEVVEELPATGKAGVFYFVPSSDPDQENVYDEYVWITTTQSYELIGSTEIDLSGKLDVSFSGANPYDNTQTYAVGDKVTYNGKIYKCTTAVTTAEDFENTKWTEVTLSDYVDLESSQTISGLKTFAGMIKFNTQYFGYFPGGSM